MKEMVTKSSLGLESVRTIYEFIQVHFALEERGADFGSKLNSVRYFGRITELFFVADLD